MSEIFHFNNLVFRSISRTVMLFTALWKLHVTKSSLKVHDSKYSHSHTSKTIVAIIILTVNNV